MKTSFSFSHRFVTRFLLRIIAGLIILYLVTQIRKVGFGLERGSRLFDLDTECAFPAYFSALQLLGASLLLAMIAREHRRNGARSAHHFWVLALGFSFLSLDEACSIHEHFTNKRLEAAVHASEHGVLHFPWVIAGGFVATVVGLYFVPFLHRLESPSRRRFIVSGLTFLGGALGMEMLGANYASTHGMENFGYIGFVTVEETMEMIGAALFIRALLLYIETTFGVLKVSFGRSPEPSG